MKKEPESQSVDSRRWPWLVAAFLLALALGMWLAISPGTPPPREAADLAPDTAEQPPSPASPPPAARRKPPSPQPKKVAALPTAPVAPPEAPEPPEPPEPLEGPPSDPFEPQDGQEAPIRTLVTVGDIRLGVVRDSQIHDEAGLKKVLVQIGQDLEERIRDSQEEGAPGLQEVLDGYREELGEYMTGEVELRGPDWMIGAEVGPPRRREDVWRPRPQ